MALYASLSGFRVVSATLTMAMFGTWVADVTLPDSTLVPDSCELTIANLELVGHVYRQGPFAGGNTVRVVGGAGGWRKTLQARTYQQPGGILLSMVLRDAAIEVGETLVLATDSILGIDFVREAAPASRLLRQLVGRSWWMDEDGKTRIGSRSTSTVKSEFLVTRYNGGKGSLGIATEDLASWLPGASFSNALVEEPLTVSSMTVSMKESGEMRLEVLV